MSRTEPPLSALVVDTIGGFFATVVMMLAVLVAVGAWSMHWPLVFIGALTIALVAHAGHRRGLLAPTVSMPAAIERSLIELGPLVGGCVVAVSLATGETGWVTIGGGVIIVGLLAKLLS